MALLPAADFGSAEDVAQGVLTGCAPVAGNWAVTAPWPTSAWRS
jgi:hypothetical protein